MRRRSPFAPLLAVAVAASSLASTGASRAQAAAPAVSYTYDSLGRLHAVTDTTGATATYSYDAVGNLLSVVRGGAVAHKAATVGVLPAPTVSAVSPTTAAPGVHIMITGSHFQPDVSENKVKIGNLYAEVVRAGVDRLEIIVPLGASTGDLTVTGPGGRAGGTHTVKVDRPQAKQEISAKAAVAPLTAPKGTTALSGRAVKLDGSSLRNVTVSVDNITTRSDTAGRFLLSPLSAGHHQIVIDGATAAGPAHYGFYEEGVDTPAGKTTVLAWDTWMPAIDEAHAVAITATTTSEVVVTNPTLPGVEVHIPPGTSIVDHYGHPVTKITLTPMAIDKTPVPLAPGMPIFFDLQPGGAYVDNGGLRIVYPNVTSQQPGRHVDYVQYNPDTPGMGWQSYGGGTVTASGTQIVPDADTGVYEVTPFGVLYSPRCTGQTCPKAGDKKDGGDPVDLGTGLFTLNSTDIGVADTIPVALTRTYRQDDNFVRPFGIGQSDPYDLFIAPDSVGNYVLQLPDGGAVPFAPDSTGVYRSKTTPTAFYGATLDGTHRDFVATLKDGTTYTFGTETATLTAITDRFGQTLNIDRDVSSGQLRQVTTPNGRWVAFTWAPCDGTTQCISTARDNAGRTVHYAYDGAGHLTTVTDPAGRMTTYTWAPCNDAITCTEIRSITDARHTTFLANTFDTNGRVKTQTQADDGIFRFAYTLNTTTGAVTTATLTDPRGFVRKVVYNANGYPTTDTSALGRPEQETTTYTRNVTTNLVSATTDALGRKTTYTYDPSANPTTITQLAGTTQAITTKLTYEPIFDRPATVTDPLGHVTRYAYNDAAQTITATDPLGHVAVSTLSDGQPVSIKDALGHTGYISYLDGDVVAAADPLGRVTTRYTDNTGRLIRSTDPLGNFTQYSYDNDNAVLSTTDAAGGITSSTYDDNGNRLTFTDANHNITRWAYDQSDRAESRTDPLGRQETFTYDTLGNLTQVTDRNGITDDYTYDALSRPLTTGFGLTAPATYQSTIGYTYDLGNRVRQVTDSTAGTISQDYDNLSRVTSATTPQGAIAYTYDNAGRRQSMTVAGQPQVTYSYDNANRLTTIAQGPSTVGFGYDNANRRTSLTLPNGVVQTYAYDNASELAAITYKSGAATLGTLTYTYDKDSQRTATGGTHASSGLPDAVAATSYNADNELVQRGAAALTYDAEGELLTDGTSTYSWNARHQLQGVTGPVTATFTYDAAGHRTSKTAGATTTTYLYDEANAVQELSGGTATANMLTGPVTDETFQRATTGGTTTLLTDALGSTIGLSDASRTTQTTYTYDPFGRTTSAGGANNNPAQYAGRENDGTGLYYNRARYYSPTLGRFISQDPIGFQGGDQNLYAYTGNSPTNLTDPSGLKSWFDRFKNWAGDHATEIAVAVAVVAVVAVTACVLAAEVCVPFLVRVATVGAEEAPEVETVVGDVTAGGETAAETAAEGGGGSVPIGGPQQFEPVSLTGQTPAEVQGRIPSDWVQAPSKSGGGEVFSDPANPGRQIRIMPGYGEGVRPDPLTAGPYAVVSQNGVVTKVPLAGNPTLP